MCFIQNILRKFDNVLQVVDHRPTGRGGWGGGGGGGGGGVGTCLSINLIHRGLWCHNPVYTRLRSCARLSGSSLHVLGGLC